MSQNLNSAVAVIGIDIGKNSFHVVGLDDRGAIVLRQKWSRGQIEARLANLPPCLIGMEACVGAHHLSRKLKALGHDARLMLSNGCLKEGDGTLFALVGHDLHESDARGIVDADMHVFPADAQVTVDGARISAGDAMSDRADPPSFLISKVDEFAWPVAFVASDWFSRLRGTELVQPQPTQNAADGGRRDIGLGGDLLARPALPTQALHLIDSCLGRWLP